MIKQKASFFTENLAIPSVLCLQWLSSSFVLILLVLGVSALMSLLVVLTLQILFGSKARNMLVYKTLPYYDVRDIIPISNHQYPVFTAHTLLFCKRGLSPPYYELNFGFKLPLESMMSQALC